MCAECEGTETGRAWPGYVRVGANLCAEATMGCWLSYTSAAAVSMACAALAVQLLLSVAAAAAGRVSRSVVPLPRVQGEQPGRIQERAEQGANALDASLLTVQDDPKQNVSSHARAEKAVFRSRLP